MPIPIKENILQGLEVWQGASIAIVSDLSDIDLILEYRIFEDGEVILAIRPWHATRISFMEIFLLAAV